MQVEKIQLKTIKLETLNAECLVAVNRCAHYLKQHHDLTLRLQDRDVLMQLSRIVRNTDDPELGQIYMDLKDKMVRCVNQMRLNEMKK